MDSEIHLNGQCSERCIFHFPKKAAELAMRDFLDELCGSHNKKKMLENRRKEGAPYCSTAKFDHPYHGKETNHAQAGQLLPNFTPSGAPYSTAKFDHPYHGEEMNHARAGQLLSNFIPSGSCLNPLTVDSGFQGTENQQNDTGESSLQSESFDRGSCLNPLTVDSGFQGTENQQNDTGESSLQSESFDRASSGTCNSHFFVNSPDEVPVKHNRPFKSCNSALSPVWEASLILSQYEDCQKKGIPPAEIVLYFLQDEYGGQFPILEGLTRCHPKCEKCLNRSYYKNYAVLAPSTGSNLFPDFEWNKENRQWNQHEKNIPHRPPACVVCLSNPSKDNLFCTDCLKSIKD